MPIIEWKNPGLDDVKIIQRVNQDLKTISSDASATNIYLLREKHKIKIAWINNLLVREYSPLGDLSYVDGITFPLGNAKNEIIKETIDQLIQDRINRGLRVQFCFLDDNQKDFLNCFWNGFKFENHKGLSDYLYSAKHLAYLSGRSNHKKKNRFLKFSKTYPHYEVAFFENDSSEEMLDVAKKWLNSQTQLDNAKFLELASIEEAIRIWNRLQLVGIVIKANNIPVAMSVASHLSDGVYDIHFEKSYGEYAENGAYAAVNMLFAKWLFETKNAKWINREEDLDDIGLRKAKSSYHPDLMLDKYSGTINSE